MATTVYTAIIEREGNLYAALCPELDVANDFCISNVLLFSMGGAHAPIGEPRRA